MCIVESFQLPGICRGKNYVVLLPIQQIVVAPFLKNLMLLVVVKSGKPRNHYPAEVDRATFLLHLLLPDTLQKFSCAECPAARLTPSSVLPTLFLFVHLLERQALPTVS